MGIDVVNKADYNNETVKLGVAPVEIFDLGKKVNDLSTAIANNFLAIHAQWEDLALGWAGKSQQESQDFSDKYKVALDDFFGEEGADTDANKKQGVINRVAGGVQGAGDAYAQAEVNLFYAFKWFADSLEFPDKELDTSVRDHANVDPPEKGPDPTPGERDFTGPPIGEKTSGGPTPWFKEGEPVKGEWSWVETVDGPNDKRITVKDGAIWTGYEGDGVTVEWVPDAQ
ncbi:hypothetical protein JOD64_000717 [Micromonospora luteifusca]|uniref:WXG100 family type VII secretion target n=1 Tax=Micromonospora luteifusca TaxID=709860 RepID=A0ABS2LMS3_9ACTN|nr:hypothetical protein [Micromonospora luteifusca]MBM7489495.1 hypothetical protein [Micromonospora luteifusca]